ncbi:hypothetical protein DL93DRAFT_2034714, partial [Clavulina sp. PMI_390]
IPPNPDVSGIGIRIGIYISTGLIALLANPDTSNARLNELWEGLIISAGINGFALLITAVIQTALHNLDLYHAIIVMHQLTFLGVTTASSGSYRARKLQLVYYLATTLAAGVLLAGWSMYVWIMARSFGASLFPSRDPQCNDSVKYVIMFVTARATVSWVRWLSVTLISITFLGSLLRVVMLTWVNVLGDDEVTNNDYGFLSYVSRGAYVYNVIILELTIKRNNIALGETVWSFGQIVPVVIAATSAINVLFF